MEKIFGLENEKILHLYSSEHVLTKMESSSGILIEGMDA
jgi:hypothetical protein